MQLLFEPVVARDEGALRVLMVRGVVSGRKKARKGGVELRVRIGFPVFCREESGIVGEAAQAGQERIRLIVEKIMPLDALRKLFCVRVRDEFVEVTGCGRLAGRCGEQKQDKPILGSDNHTYI